MLDYIDDYKIERSEDHEISNADKIEYNRLRKRVNNYSKLSKELQDKHADDFTKLVEEMDKLMSEMGVDNASTDEWKNGFKIEEGEK